ncbi:hypothetical protein OY671_011777, partial [Metschnikowia pulcherrima]
ADVIPGNDESSTADAAVWAQSTLDRLSGAAGGNGARVESASSSPVAIALKSGGSKSGGVLPSSRSAALPVAISSSVVSMVVPIPSASLDVFCIMNITISSAVSMVSLNAQKPLDFSAFPTVLSFATLFRLSLNVASTR